MASAKEIASDKRPRLIARGVCSHHEGMNEHIGSVQIAIVGSTIEDVGGELMPCIVISVEDVLKSIAVLSRASIDAGRASCE